MPIPSHQNLVIIIDETSLVLDDNLDHQSALT
jgi:hypothetical protein